MEKKRVLIIEDEMDILDLVDYNLTRKGYMTCGALDGADGLEKALTFTPDLVILDLMLPGIDGWRLCSLLKEKRRELPVLVLTAKCMPEDRAVGFEAGADDYMTKPFEVKELIFRVGRLLKEDGCNGDITALS
ncbi:MAG TPA: hypothetical protein DDW94_06125 [Deltaproteobacteria bacterium]|nr:MAG: hypothetical protein A2Z79_00655 [Deltaproteobacteria bacterium GWA2_55_82]OGQ64888.1 MAG: hypothetical protein A3I81_04765 [Deltaproteobacteria bacterium RIFCSPLOWO2_02_FULL_55_12]OIJ73955.1 MAG: hypothetical protein A2V21_306560 [Deltaproteobacteria bacterium GWC2_55_46]HBG46553.1 hypothetical protein [Deltaproteobacteria bacterium]HCY09955.1 hypothetical protein [Deltaproteobacteria bacterium]